MTVLDIAIQSVLSLLVALGGSGIFVWVARTWMSEKIKNAIKSEYDIRLESHKALLKAEADLELEKLRSQLAREAKEHDVVFSKLHEKRGEVIADIYAKLKRVKRHLGEYTKLVELRGEQPREERYKSLVKSHTEFLDAFEGNSIFLPASTTVAIEEFNRLVLTNGLQFSMLVTNDKFPDRQKLWNEINDGVEKIIPAVLDKLEKELRALLGYPQEPAP